jgi:hypothetical protein
VPDERDVTEVVPDRKALSCLIGREDVFELLEANRRAVAQVDVDRLETVLVRKLLQPSHVLGRQLARMQVERLAGRLIVVAVVHPSGDRGVVVSKNRDLGDVAHDVGACIGAPTVPDDIAQAVVRIDVFAAIRFHDGGHRF